MGNYQHCWLQITSGRGPDECAYFVGKLLQLIIDEAKNFKIKSEVIEAIPGNKPETYLSVLVSLKGEACPDFAKQWKGTVQWISKSPFRPHHKRKNWFVGVDILTPLEEYGKLSEKDVKFQSMRASGPGGQNVNKTETAVRVIHIPTGITVTASEERSQYMNKKLALAKLVSLLESQEQESLKQAESERWSKHNELERGNPIRVYEGEKFKRKKIA